MADTKSTSGLVENRTIDWVPPNERHGTPFSQFTLWFGSNTQITAIVDGALAIAVFKSDALWAIIALLIGNILGGTIMALHSAQGPTLGLPQMISSRAQFGVIGAIFPLVLVVLMYIGFASTGAVAVCRVNAAPSCSARTSKARSVARGLDWLLYSGGRMDPRMRKTAAAIVTCARRERRNTSAPIGRGMYCKNSIVVGHALSP